MHLHNTSPIPNIYEPLHHFVEKKTFHCTLSTKGKKRNIKTMTEYSYISTENILTE